MRFTYFKNDDLSWFCYTICRYTADGGDRGEKPVWNSPARPIMRTRVRFFDYVSRRGPGNVNAYDNAEGPGDLGDKCSTLK